MTRVAVQAAGVWMGQCLCAAPQLQTQSPRDTATAAQINTPPPPRSQDENHTSFWSQFNKKKGQAAHYIGPIWVREQMQM